MLRCSQTEATVLPRQDLELVLRAVPLNRFCNKSAPNRGEPGPSVRSPREHAFVHLSDRNLSEISERIVYLEMHARLRKAEWLEYVAEFDRRGAAHRRGFATTAEWLAFECDMDRRTARDAVRVARRLR